MSPLQAGRRGFLSLISLACVVPAAQGHVHIQVGHGTAGFDLHVLDFESGRFEAEAYPFFVALAARGPVPADPRFQPLLGPPGSTAWILPQNEVEGVLNLGLGSSGIPGGTFAADQLQLTLERFEGPGRFLLYTLSPFGSPVVHMNSGDGVDPVRDFIVLPAVNGHIHVNWAFTRAGTYHLELAAQGSLAATGQVRRSEPIRCTFIVEAPPSPVLGAVRMLPDSGLELRVAAAPGERTRIEASNDLMTWVPVLLMTGTGEPIPILIPGATGAGRFFRAVIDEGT